MGVIHRRIADSPTWSWEGVEVEGYGENGSIQNTATRQVLIGSQDGAPHFALRYFTIPPRGFSNLDHHEHDHGVMIMQGRARVLLGERYEEVSPGDIVYIPGWERHQFENLTDEPLSFLCIIPPKTAQPDICAVLVQGEESL